MKKKILLAGLALTCSLAYATDFKLGYVDVAKIFTTSKPAVAMQNTLKTRFAPQQQEIKKMNDNLVKEQNQMQVIMKKAPSMDKLAASDKATLEKLGTQYQKDQMTFQQKYMTFQQNVQKTQDIASALVLNKTNLILKDISDKGGYDLVLTSNQLVYAKAKYDLTDQVIEQLNTVNSSDLLKQLDKAVKEQSNALPGSPTLTAPVK